MKYELTLKFNDGRALALGIFEGDNLGAATEKCNKQYKAMFKKLVCNAHRIEHKILNERVSDGA